MLASYLASSMGLVDGQRFIRLIRLIGHCGQQVKEYWGQGLATEAAIMLLRYGFATLQLERLVALAKPKNFASQRVMKKMYAISAKHPTSWC